MKASEVLKILGISRPTLYRYRKEKFINAIRLPNTRWDYDEESVYEFLHKDIPRKVFLYARVSTRQQKKELENQIFLFQTWCFQNGLQINGIFSDIASGISFEKRANFFQMLDDIFDRKVEKVIITSKERISRVGFELFQYLFKKFGTAIVVISEIGNEKLDSQEIFEEIVSLLHWYSMKLYSKRKKPLIQQLITKEEK
ncbi:MAG: IS607 family transposase [Promethearchaeota archaeon]